MPSGPVSYIQDANPFQLKQRQRLTPEIAPEYLRENVIPSAELPVQEIPLEDLAPASRPSGEPDKQDKVYKPEVGPVVFKPEYTTTTVSTTTTTTEPTTTTTVDPIADHVSLLLQQYFSTQTPDTSDTLTKEGSNGVPMITYDDENDSIVMEYLSPDGVQDKVDQGNPEAGIEQQVEQNVEQGPTLEEFFNNYQDPEQPQAPAFPLPSFLPRPENPELLTLPQMSDMDRFFVPSKKTNEADWFILDEDGKRRVIKENEVVPEEKPISYLPFDEMLAADAAKEAALAEEKSSDESIIEDNIENNDDDVTENETPVEIERETVGDFQPVVLHKQEEHQDPLFEE